MGSVVFTEKIDDMSMSCFERGAEIAEFFRTTFPMSGIEGDRLIGYMEGHGYLLAHKDEELYRGDLCYGADDIYWETYTLYDAVETIRAYLP